MKLALLQEDLNRALATVVRFVASRPQLPVLANILFSAEKNNQLRLAATNLDLGVQFWLPAKVDQPGQLAIPAKEISEFISYLPAAKLTLSSEDKLRLKVTTPTGETVFSGLAADEFPQFPELDQKKMVQLKLEALKEAVGQVAFAAANDDTRPVLTALQWQFQSQGYQLVATDGYRLSLKTVAESGLKLANQEKATFLVPARSLTEWVRLASNESEFGLGLTPDQNQVIFLLPQLQLSARLIEGDFPEYQKIIPHQTKTEVVLEREPLIQAIRMASVFARESANIVKLVIKENQVAVMAQAASVGENKTLVEAQVQGPELTIAFNYRFLLDFLNAVPETETEVVLKFNEPLSPGVFQARQDSSWLHLIMPVRVGL